MGGSEAPVWLELVSREGEKGDRRWTGLINSTTEDPEGILEVQAALHFNCSRNCLLRSMATKYTIRFYREDHSGPFPEGFIGFVHDDFRRDNSHLYCSVNRSCHVYCQTVGSDPPTTKISKLAPNGEMTPINVFTMSGNYWSFAQLVTDNVSFADAGDFRCTARSQTREVTEDLSLVVVKDVKIDRELSTATQFEDGVSEYSCEFTSV